MRSALCVTALMLVSAGCKGAAEPRPVSLQVQASSPAEVVLAIGGEVRVDSLLRVGFLSVPADSRCPTTVVCVWAGDGLVEIAYGIGMGPSYPDTLHTALDPTGAQFAGYLITLLDLMPYPNTTNGIPADEYAARLRIERSRP